MTDETLQAVVRRALPLLSGAARDQYSRERDSAFGAYCAQMARNLDNTVNAATERARYLRPYQGDFEIAAAWDSYYARQRTNKRAFRRAIIRSLRAALQATTGE